MTTETGVEDARFQRYCERYLPPYLTGSEPGPTYPGTAKQWATDKALVLSELRQRWSAQLALGFTPAELVGDAPWPETYARDGSPKRPMEPELPADICQQASHLLNEAYSRSLRLDAVDELKLERAAGGFGCAQTIEGVLRSVRGQIQHVDAVAQAVKIESDSRPVLTVLVPFRMPTHPTGGYAPGVHRISVEQARELAEWARKVDAQAAQGDRGYEAIGYPEWPVFTLEGLLAPAPAPDAGRMWEGQP